MIDRDPDPKPDEPATSANSAADRLAALRIIDANFNRAAEGLRVVEEHCRFALNDRHLTERCKQLRHELTSALAALPKTHLHAARETQSDVGTSVSTSAEGTRKSLAHVAAASWQRVEQALRAIEEYVKLLSPAIAPRIENLRYQSYTLAKACTITAASRDQLASARLYVLLDGRSSEQIGPVDLLTGDSFVTVVGGRGAPGIDHFAIGLDPWPGADRALAEVQKRFPKSEARANQNQISKARETRSVMLKDPNGISVQLGSVKYQI